MSDSSHLIKPSDRIKELVRETLVEKLSEKVVFYYTDSTLYVPPISEENAYIATINTEYITSSDNKIIAVSKGV